MVLSKGKEPVIQTKDGIRLDYTGVRGAMGHFNGLSDESVDVCQGFYLVTHNVIADM
jgi:hypothetical protein